MTRLDTGLPFPELEVPRVGGGTLSLPGELSGHYGVILFYRGSWCPYCNAQLTAFQRAGETLAKVGVRVAALSVDDEAASHELVERHHLGFAVGYGADVDEIAKATGAYVNDGSGADPRRYLQSTGFVLAPDGTVLTAVYSSGAIGRLVPADVAGFVGYLREHG
jgi:peroxiredoxin